jgi:hypothetical protein
LAILTVRCFLKIIQALEKLKLLGAIYWWLCADLTEWLWTFPGHFQFTRTHEKLPPTSVRLFSFLFIWRVIFWMLMMLPWMLLEALYNCTVKEWQALPTTTNKILRMSKCP